MNNTYSPHTNIGIATEENTPISYTLTCIPSSRNNNQVTVSITGLGGINISSTTDMNFLKMQLI